jgi:preprotein translocase subunit YajC
MEQLTQYFNILTTNEWLMSSVVVVLVMSLSSFRRQRKLQQQQSLSMQSLQRDLRALANAAVGVGGRVLEIERNQRKRPVIVTSQEQPKIQPATTTAPVEYYSSANQPYEQAIRMAQTGASVEDIVNVCGLSKSEADLVCMMHRLDKAS